LNKFYVINSEYIPKKRDTIQCGVAPLVASISQGGIAPVAATRITEGVSGFVTVAIAPRVVFIADVH
jgi:hypothetical protein